MESCSGLGLACEWLCHLPGSRCYSKPVVAPVQSLWCPLSGASGDICLEPLVSPVQSWGSHELQVQGWGVQLSQLRGGDNSTGMLCPGGMVWLWSPQNQGLILFFHCMWFSFCSISQELLRLLDCDTTSSPGDSHLERTDWVSPRARAGRAQGAGTPLLEQGQPPPLLPGAGVFPQVSPAVPRSKHWLLAAELHGGSNFS